MSKITKNERISMLEDAVAMNWPDIKKIETKISRAMTDMATRISNISLQLEGQQRQIHLAADSIGLNKQAIIMLENKAEPEPQLKQLDHSVFDHPYVDDRFNYVALNADGQAVFFGSKPVISNCLDIWVVHTGSVMPMLKGYDTSNWQNSLIERDTAKEPLEIDLSSELTGSDLCRAMLGRSNEYVTCLVGDECEESAKNSEIVRVICSRGADYFDDTTEDMWYFAIPINNQGEPLTASEVGL